MHAGPRTHYEGVIVETSTHSGQQRKYHIPKANLYTYTCVPVTCTVSTDDAVEAHSCIDIVAKFTDEQYTTINQTKGRMF